MAAYARQQRAEQVFRVLKGDDGVGWGPMSHWWTDNKIRVHPFYCLLGVSLQQYLRQKAEPVWPDLTPKGPIDRPAVPLPRGERSAPCAAGDVEADPDPAEPSGRTGAGEAGPKRTWVIRGGTR